MESVRSGDSSPSQGALRHDLLNTINVVIGATSGLRAGALTESQRTWVQMLEAATLRLARLADTLGRDDAARADADRARFADLCSIAAARVGKPFDRQRLLAAIAAVGGHDALRILLVDDSQEVVTVVRSYLQGTPWTLDAVETGERAVERAAAEHYDVVLMDIDLPGLDGTAAAHAIRAADLARGASPTPIIAMTAFDPQSGTGIRDQGSGIRTK